MSEETPHYHQHRQRLRERFRHAGPEGLADYELLELLLTYALPRRDVKPLAKALIARFGSLRGVLEASPAELAAEPGLGPAAAVLPALVKALLARYLAAGTLAGQTLASPAAVVDYARVQLGGLRHEALLVVFLSNASQVLGHEICHEGSSEQAVVYPRRVIARALELHANALILVHNHPGGDCTPSAADLRLTQTLKHLAEGLELRLLDHLIVSAAGHYSFAANGLLATWE